MKPIRSKKRWHRQSPWNSFPYVRENYAGIFHSKPSSSLSISRPGFFRRDPSSRASARNSCFPNEGTSRFPRPWLRKPSAFPCTFKNPTPSPDFRTAGSASFPERFSFDFRKRQSFFRAKNASCHDNCSIRASHGEHSTVRRMPNAGFSRFEAVSVPPGSSRRSSRRRKRFREWISKWCSES